MTTLPEVPHRPRVRSGLAVLRRGPGELQIGVDPRHAVVIDGLSPAAVDALLVLDGRHTVAELGEKVPELIEILPRLADAGLLARPQAPPSVAVHGSGPLADAVRELLAPAPDPDLTILTDLVPPPELVASLMAGRTPHLAVQAREGVGLIGPLVLPGRTSCLTCADLHRADLDPSWPLVAAQLAARPVPPDPVTITATAAFAAAQAERALDVICGSRLRPPTWNGTVEVHPLSGSAEKRSRYPHPDCQCAAHNMAE